MEENKKPRRTVAGAIVVGVMLGCFVTICLALTYKVVLWAL